jgi:YegS/Rv2252/BmrU family lipid kinase
MVPALLVVFNPAAGRRRAHLLWRVLDVMAENGVRLEIVETRHAGHATDLARTAAAAGAGLIVAAGGDGTIAEVANGINGSDCRLGVIPLGTANVMAHELGLPFRARDVAAALAFGRTRTIWPGIATGGGAARVFVQMLGAGFDAQVVHNLPAPLKRALGRTAYVAQTLRETLRYRFEPIGLCLDGIRSETVSVIVSKGRYYGGRFQLCPGADPGCPGFTVAMFDRPGPLHALLYGAALPLNRLSHMPGLRLVRASCIEIESAGVLAQTDGDPAGQGPLRVADAGGPIRIIVG